jgi:hypothetical protein
MSDVTQPPSALTVFLVLPADETDPRVRWLPEGAGGTNALRSRPAGRGIAWQPDVRRPLHAAARVCSCRCRNAAAQGAGDAPVYVVASDLGIMSR